MMRAYCILAAFLASMLLLAGCASSPGQNPEGADPSRGNLPGASNTDAQGSQSGESGIGTGNGTAAEALPDEESGAPEADTTGDGSQAVEAAGSSGRKTSVLMLGRSVAYGWAEHMGLEWQEDESYLGEYDGKSIRYLHMDYPPDIDDSAIRAMGTYDFDVVFFKLCFVDFGSEYGDMLSDNKQYVVNVYNEAVVKRKKKLIVGNALPQVSRDTTSGLTQNHKDYDAWLDDFASKHEGVYVLDLNGMLSDSNGALKPEYALSYDDSHLNDGGYGRITPAFMDAIDEAAEAG